MQPGVIVLYMQSSRRRPQKRLSSRTSSSPSSAGGCGCCRCCGRASSHRLARRVLERHDEACDAERPAASPRRAAKRRAILRRARQLQLRAPIFFCMVLYRLQIDKLTSVGSKRKLLFFIIQTYFICITLHNDEIVAKIRTWPFEAVFRVQILGPLCTSSSMS